MQRQGSSLLDYFPLTPALIVVGVGAFGYAVQVSNGSFSPKAEVILLIVYICIALAFAALGLRSSQRVSASIAWLATLPIFLFLYIHAACAPLDGYAFKESGPIFHTSAVPPLAVCALACIFLPRKLAKWAVILLAITFIAIGVWLMHEAPHPIMDVDTVTHDACVAITHGINPYSITFPDVYAGYRGREQAFYPMGMLVNNRILFGYQYTPLSFAVAFVGYLMDDFRYGNLLAIAVAAVLIAFSTPHRLSTLAAVVFLLMPRNFFVVEMGWSEPVVVLTLGMVLFCALRRPAMLPYATGLLLVSKQHLFLIVPIVLLLIPQPWTFKRVASFAIKAIAAGTIVSLPLILWNVQAFWHSAIEVQLKNPFRIDSLNFAAWWQEYHKGEQAPSIISFILAASACALCLWRSPRTPAGFSFSAAVVYLAFFAFAKQAFCNYYFMTIAFLCAALAAWGIPGKRDEPALPLATSAKGA